MIASGRLVRVGSASTGTRSVTIGAAGSASNSSYVAPNKASRPRPSLRLVAEFLSIETPVLKRGPESVSVHEPKRGEEVAGVAQPRSRFGSVFFELCGDSVIPGTQESGKSRWLCLTNGVGSILDSWRAEGSETFVVAKPVEVLVTSPTRELPSLPSFHVKRNRIGN